MSKLKETSYNGLSKCLFSDFFLHPDYIFLFYRLFDNVLMKRCSLCGRRGNKKAFKNRKICEVTASKWILFI